MSAVPTTTPVTSTPDTAEISEGAPEPMALSEVENDVYGLVQANAGAIDADGDGTIKWKEVKEWAKNNEDTINEAGLDFKSFKTNTGKGFSWQDIAKASGGETFEAKNGETRYGFKVDAAPLSAEDETAPEVDNEVTDAPAPTEGADDGVATFLTQLDTTAYAGTADNIIGPDDILKFDINNAPEAAKGWLQAAQGAFNATPPNEQVLTSLGFSKNDSGVWVIDAEKAKSFVGQPLAMP